MAFINMLWKQLLLIIALKILTATSQAQTSQKFRVQPHDLTVLEGSEALLRCEVTNVAGQMQWTKDGFALGFVSGSIPGFPRFTAGGDKGQGVYNLRISNASIDDDAEYQCQVGPAKFHSAIRATAKLTVIAPPSSVEIQGYNHNSKVEVRENQDLTLTCIVSNAKPAAEIKWYRGNVEYKPAEGLETHITETANGKRFTVTSRLQLKPTSADDYMEYSCQAKHKALQPDMPMKATVQLSVLYPPGEPYIEGYTPGEKLRRGQTVKLTCKSRGGNPPAQLIWYKNGAQVRMAYRTQGRVSENVYEFAAEAGDNKARFRCEASNVMSQTPLKTEVELAVLFAPSHLTITGPTEARVGDQVQLSCATAASNPAAEIKWTVGGKQIKNAPAKTVASPEGGWITSSNISTTIEANKRSLPVLCHGINMQLAENVVSTHTVNILHPPSPPIITGYVEGSIIPAGSITKLLCVSTGGNPLATLTWYKNDKKINSVVKTMDKTVSAELTVLANVTDNQARYKCEAQNSATEIPMFETKTLSVHFAPETVKITVEPAELKPGTVATLHCDSSSSNPPAELSWWREGIAIPSANITETKPGLWFGTVSHAALKVNITQDMNGIMYTCQSQNEKLQRSVHEAINLQVLFRPKFKPPPSSTAVGVEGESLVVAIVAEGNPASIQYTWTKDGLPILPKNGIQRIVSEGPILNITKLNRDDAGIYTCEAINSQGSDMINITVVVEYGASIKSISENVVVNPGEDAMLSCAVEGKPLNEEHIRWERTGYEMTVRTSTTYANGTSYLHIKDARRPDVGNFRCIADNRVANPTSRDVLLIVKFAPEIDKSPTMLKAASGANERGRLICRAMASPRPTFVWSRGGQVINVNQSAKYTGEMRAIDALTFESVLIIARVAPADYGDYECQAKNDLGSTNETINLKVTSPPDPPLELSILNVTHDSVTLAWSPGFDGGMKASFRVRYREANAEHYKYEDGIPNSQKLTIHGLRMNTLYVFSVQAMNQLGLSPFLPDTKRAQTLGVEPLPAELMEKGEMPLLVILAIAVACIVLLLVNAGLVVWYVMKRKSKEASGQNSKTATIEMYAPSSYNDTVTGETLSSVSEKSETYSNDGSQPDYIQDETRKKAQSTYLVEGSDIPPPRYQKDGTLPSHYPPMINNIGNHTRTLPHPRHNNNVNYEIRARDDQMLNAKTNYVTAPSPGPPLDGSYYNMNSDRYLSYPPMDYSTLDFSTPPVPMLPQHMQMTGGGTLRRGMTSQPPRGLVPPPDVTQMTTLHSNLVLDHTSSPNSMLGNSTLSNNISGGILNSTPKQPQGILKDPNRPKQPAPTLQILSVPTNPPPTMLGGTGSLLISTGYDPTGANLSSFNASLGYTDADGHLV